MKNKIIFIVVVCAIACMCTSYSVAQTPADTTLTTTVTFPQYYGYVNDFEKVLDTSTVEALTSLITAHEQKTTDQIAVVTVATYAPYSNLQEYTTDLSNYWGVGTKKKNNGVIVVLSMSEREVRIGTGLGLERKLTDKMCREIIDEKMIPAFKQGDYNRGVTDGVKEIIRLLEAK